MAIPAQRLVATAPRLDAPVPWLIAALLLTAAAHGGEAAGSTPGASGARTARELLRQVHSPRATTITFVHRVSNTAPQALEDVRVAVALPGSDERQRILSIQCLPEPERRTEDAWGQATAHFRIARLGPGEEASFRVRVNVVLSGIEWLVTARDVGGLRDLPGHIQRQYLRDGENYQLDAAVLREAAAALSQAGPGVLEKVRAIHDFVIDRLEYRRDDRWDPADRTLRSGSGSCTEYAYLMIALCRLQGIPARYAGGTWLEDAEELPHVDRIFHRWVEVYLPRIGWYPIDPTQDDRGAREGDPYRCFGRLPWHYLTMARGDGDRFEGGSLGWEYRSSMRWRGAERWLGPDIPVDRFTVWSDPLRPRLLELGN